MCVFGDLDLLRAADRLSYFRVQTCRTPIRPELCVSCYTWLTEYKANKRLTDGLFFLRALCLDLTLSDIQDMPLSARPANEERLGELNDDEGT